jgi:hypothetical protein
VRGLGEAVALEHGPARLLLEGALEVHRQGGAAGVVDTDVPEAVLQEVGPAGEEAHVHGRDPAEHHGRVLPHHLHDLAGIELGKEDLVEALADAEEHHAGKAEDVEHRQDAHNFLVVRIRAGVVDEHVERLLHVGD